MRLLGLVALGGALGCCARYLIDLWANWDVLLTATFPWPTLIINVVGCLAIGAVSVLITGGRRERQWRAFLVTGFLGGFTTFSAFALETVVLLDQGLVPAAVGYLAGTLVFGAVAVRIGVTVAGVVAVRRGAPR